MTERTARVAAPVALALFVLVGLATSDQPRGPAVAAALLAVAGGVVLAALGSRGWALVAGALVAGAALTVLCWGDPANLGWFGICVLAGWVAFRARPVGAALFGAVAVVTFAVQAVAVRGESGWGAWPAGTVFTIVACALAARQRELLVALREAQAGLAERSRAEERTRIAHEMHDVVGHALTVTLLHLDSARLALDDDPAAVRESLGEAQRQARRSLEEIRASVGLLRGGGEEGADAARPLPGGADLADLVDSFRRTGAAVSLEVVGDPAAMPAGPGLAAYRIVQEALTNAARHAPGAPSSVRVEVDRAAATVRVESAGAPGSGPAGTGLLGIHERARAVGGTAQAGPAGTGWRVEAVLPR